MLHELLAEAWEGAGKSKPDVRAAALLRIARVQTSVDREQARKTFRQALDETRELPGLDGQVLLQQARQVAAAGAPDILKEIPSVGGIPRDIESERLAGIMLEHGHADAAFEYLMHYDEALAFPF